MSRQWIILNEHGDCAEIAIPGRSCEFRILPIFMTRRQARACMANLPDASERKIVSADAMITGPKARRDD